MYEFGGDTHIPSISESWPGEKRGAILLFSAAGFIVANAFKRLLPVTGESEEQFGRALR